MATDLQNAWLKLVLGLDPGAEGDAAPGAGKTGLLAMPGVEVKNGVFHLNGQALEPIDVLALMVEMEGGGGARRKVKDPARDGRRIWQEARETVDAQITELQSFLRDADDPDLRAVGEAGLASRTKGLNTALVKALADLGSAREDAKPAKAKKALGAVRDYRAHIQGDTLLRLLEDNPFGIEVSITGELDGALESIEESLREAA
jgi:hypothetical protein